MGYRNILHSRRRLILLPRILTWFLHFFALNRTPSNLEEGSTFKSNQYSRVHPKKDTSDAM